MDTTSWRVTAPSAEYRASHLRRLLRWGSSALRRVLEEQPSCHAPAHASRRGGSTVSLPDRNVRVLDRNRMPDSMHESRWGEWADTRNDTGSGLRSEEANARHSGPGGNRFCDA